jgi:LIVCS family branched-chain amino acid:cation transporter
MSERKNSSPFVVGLALFAMFFGAGNLIFPLFVGHLAKREMIGAILGFLITGVLVPFLGVIAMVMYHGDYKSFFNRLGRPLGFLVTALLLTVWIPLGSAPRCIDLAHSSLASYMKAPPLWLFSIIYCVLVSLVTYRKRRMLDILGYVLTPILLISLGMIIFFGLEEAPSLVSSGETVFYHFKSGLIEGYNTMDLIASFFFSASVIGILRQSTPKGSHPLTTTFKACLVGMGLLVLVYVCLIVLAALYTDVLQGVPKQQMLAQISKVVLGEKLGFLSVIAVFLACFTTSVALVVVYAEFLRSVLFTGLHGTKRSILLTLLVTFLMSTTGLEGVTFVTAPVLQIGYPLLIVLILVNVGSKLYQMKKSKIGVEAFLD